MEQSNLEFNKIQNETLGLSPNYTPKADNIQILKDTPPHDEPGLYHGLGVFSFATATLLLGISYWDGFDNKILLTVYGFFIGGLGQLICGIMCFKDKYYIDGTVYFFLHLIGQLQLVMICFQYLVGWILYLIGNMDIII